MFMSVSFLASAGKKTTDVRDFLREAAGSGGLKYRAEQGRKHYIHFPTINVPVVDNDGNQTVQQQIIAMYGEVHEWETPDGKYKATVCAKGTVRTSEDGNTLLNDGSCPFCDRVGDAWDIQRYRCENEEKTCGLTGDALVKHMDGEKDANGKVIVNGFRKIAADERKAKPANPYMYILIVQYRTNNDGTPIIGQKGLPEYDLKVMKLSKSRVEKFQQQIENSGLKMEGCDLIIEYPKEAENAMLVVSKSTTAPVFPQSSITNKYPGLVEAIAADVAKFTWDGLDKAFVEWQGMTTAEAEKTTKELFQHWDNYKNELKVNPNAKYLEYSNNNVTQPSIGAPVANTGVMLPGAAPIVNAAPIVAGAPVTQPVVPGLNVAPVAAPVVGVQPQPVAPAVGPGQIPDANEIFGGTTGGPITI